MTFISSIFTMTARDITVTAVNVRRCQMPVYIPADIGADKVLQQIIQQKSHAIANYSAEAKSCDTCRFYVVNC